MTRRKAEVARLVAEMAAAERGLEPTLFVAPVLPGGRVRLRVRGLVYEMAVVGAARPGFAVLRCAGDGRAAVVGEPSARQIAEYRRVFPAVRLIMLEPARERWWGIAARPHGARVQVIGTAPVLLAEKVASFDTVVARCDGAALWFEGVDRRRDPRVARGLREALAADVAPDEVRAAGMTPEERAAYRMVWLQHHPERRREETLQERLAGALARGGAQLDAWWVEADESVQVRFVVDGETHVSQVRGGDFTVTSAGICLAGQDEHFDLTSLVSVLREHARDE